MKLPSPDPQTPASFLVTPIRERARLPAGPCHRCRGCGKWEGRRCRTCGGTGCFRQIVVPLPVVTMMDVSDRDFGYQRLAILHAVEAGANVRVVGMTDTGVKLTLELPAEVVRSAPTILFPERAG